MPGGPGGCQGPLALRGLLPGNGAAGRRWGGEVRGPGRRASLAQPGRYDRPAAVRAAMPATASLNWPAATQQWDAV